MKLFDKAVLKLTAIYSTILLIICVGFSAAFYGVANSEMNRPFPPNGVMIQRGFINTNAQIRDFMQRRDDSIRARLLIELIFINVGVLLAGAVASYFLAQYTLRPVKNAIEAESRFASDASHELRTPLAGMQMENEVLLRDKSTTNKDLRAGIQSNLEEIGKLRELTDRLLHLGKIDKPLLTNTNLAQVSQSAIKQLQSLATAKHIKISNQVKSINTLTDADTLHDILTALLDNAIKYSPAKSTITISANRQSINISDQGSGIAPDDLPHIFDRFYRADKARTTQGYGLGLSLAQNLAHKINAKIVAENIVDHGKIKGAKFTVKLTKGGTNE
ncbi:HAMP domain-containing histidine kinase [Candidatus Saccharibacteria bacterium]|nr:HAMP domain-containing histidine kinase [Candidatus Saccharibacteria bacterium]